MPESSSLRTNAPLVAEMRLRAALADGGFDFPILDFRTAFPDFRVTNDDIIAAADRAILRWSAHGTHQAELAGIPPTGKPVKVTGIDILRIANGKIVERWAEDNGLELMQQLGVIPSPE